MWIPPFHSVGSGSTVEYIIAYWYHHVNLQVSQHTGTMFVHCVYWHHAFIYDIMMMEVYLHVKANKRGQRPLEREGLR